MPRPRRGDIYLVNVDSTLGAAIRKTRPALVLQNDIANRSSPITIVAAITSRFDETLYPTEVLIAPKGRTGLSVDSVVLLNQLRSVDKKRLVKRLGRLAAENLIRLTEPFLLAWDWWNSRSGCLCRDRRGQGCSSTCAARRPARC